MSLLGCLSSSSPTARTEKATRSRAAGSLAASIRSECSVVGRASGDSEDDTNVAIGHFLATTTCLLGNQQDPLSCRGAERSLQCFGNPADAAWDPASSLLPAARRRTHTLDGFPAAKFKAEHSCATLSRERQALPKVRRTPPSPPSGFKELAPPPRFAFPSPSPTGLMAGPGDKILTSR